MRRKNLNEGKTLSIEGNYNLIGVRDIQILAQQFTDKIGVCVTRIKQSDAIAQFIPLRLKLRNLVAPLRKQRLVFPPSEHAARASKSEATQDHQACKCRSPRQPFAAKPINGILLLHKIDRITVNPAVQALFAAGRK